MSQGLLARLEATADRIKDLRRELRAEMDRRDGLLCEGRDTGVTYRALSRASGRSPSTIATIHGKGDPTKTDGGPRQEGTAVR